MKLTFLIVILGCKVQDANIEYQQLSHCDRTLSDVNCIKSS